MRTDPEGMGAWLVLDPSQEFLGYWEIESIYDDYFSEFEDLVGRFRVISPVRLPIFLEKAEASGYKVVFTEDPTPWIQAHAAWRDTPTVEINSTLEHTTNGFLPWQVVGFNKLIKSDLPAGYAVWDTGTGKTVLIAASILWHGDRNEYDLACVFVKRRNKIECQRKLLKLADIDSIVIDADPERRAHAYHEVLQRVENQEPTVVIANYEKIRDDKVYNQLVQDRRILFYWDEMPAKLAHRNTKLYKAAETMLRRKEKQPSGKFIKRPRPAWERHLALSATPLDTDPGDVYGCVSLMQPGKLGSPSNFQGRYVKRRHWLSGKPELWGDLDELELRLDHMLHRVSEEDPEVSKLLPKNIPHHNVLDWHPPHRRLYDKLTRKARDLYDDEEDVPVLALIQVMQMLCDAPSMVLASARNRERFEAMLESTVADFKWSGPTGSNAALRLLEHCSPSEFTDTSHSKRDWLYEIIQSHPYDKIIVHSTWGSYIQPVWEEWFSDWGVSYLIFEGTERQQQKRLDEFRTNPDIRVFLSGDAGSDSLDIPQARIGVQYNGPWGWVTETQRRGRYRRVDSQHKHVHTYYGYMANSVEDRKKALRDLKQSYHAQIFEGRANESALSARLTDEDLRYMLFGDET